MRHDDGTASVSWSQWSCMMQLVVTDPAALPAARRAVDRVLADVDRAANRFRPGSELSRLPRAGGASVRVSPTLAALVRAALHAARATDGAVDPTVGAALRALGYVHDLGTAPRDLSGLPVCGGAVRVVPRPAPGWRSIRLEGDDLTVPVGVLLDLGAVAKAWAADAAATAASTRTGAGVLVSLGGDVATAGPAPDGGWRVDVGDGPGEPAECVVLPTGGALATSSTLHRRWRAPGEEAHHILDPQTGRPAPAVWRTASVAAGSCVDANTATTAAVVRGLPAVAWLRELGLPARLVDARGGVVRTPGWPGVVVPAAG
jgi:thiamine biosynthesis lipoprotein